MDKERISKLKEQALKNIDTINKLIRDLKCGELLIKPKFSSVKVEPEEDFYSVKEIDQVKTDL
jgi:hypothetical protein